MPDASRPDVPLGGEEPRGEGARGAKKPPSALGDSGTSPAGAGEDGGRSRPPRTVSLGGLSGGTGGGAGGTHTDLSLQLAPSQEPVDASLYLHPQTLARLGSFELRARMIVEGMSSGQHRSPYHGFSVEFAQHRPYVPGDDIRHLDWKVFGRSDKLQLKQYQQETSLDLIVMVDASGSMNYGSRSFAEASGAGRKTGPDGNPAWTKFDHATALAAALSYITLRQGDRVGLVVYADSVRQIVKRSSNQQTWRQIVGALSTPPARLTPGEAPRPTNLERAMDQILAHVNNRCLIAVISDFFQDLGDVRAALAHLRHSRHDLMAFQILDRQETEFDLKETAPFEGLEGEGRVRLDPRAVRKAYLEAINGHIDQTEKLLRSFGYDYQRLGTHDWLGPPLAAFVARRNAQIKRSKYG